MIERKTDGMHEITREDGYLFIYRWGRGDITSEHVASLAGFEQEGWSDPYLYSITLFDDDSSILPGALTRGAKIYQHSPARTSAFVMRRHYLRTAMEFLVRTTRLLGLKVDAGFFEDEAKAREWIAERRKARTGR